MTGHYCTHEEECSGTCPGCEMETEELARKLKGKQICVSDSTLERIEAFGRMEDSRSDKKIDLRLSGRITLPKCIDDYSELD